MVKNIKIVTFQRAHNYGAVLQAFALKKKLENNNYLVSIVDYRNKIIELQYNPNKIFMPNLKWTVKKLVDKFRYDKLNKLRYKNFNEFIEDNFNLTERIDNFNNFEKKINNHDIVISGSDQVWNCNITGGVDKIYTLETDKCSKKISYAASIGSLDIASNEKDKLIYNISNFDSISVREESAKEFLDELIPLKDIYTVLDPTLLLTRIEWENLINRKGNVPKQKYILAYMIKDDSEFYKILNRVSDMTGLKIVHFDKQNKMYNSVLKCAYTSGPIDFVNLIKNSEYVVTTSFHATVFSIIFEKKFWVVPHKSTGSRVIDLLKKFEISNRAVNSLEEFEKLNFDEDINYKNVNKILEKEREKSINWLIDAIEK